MTRLPILLLLFALASIATAGAQVALPGVPAAAPAPASPTVSPSQAQQTLDILKNDARRAALIGTLETIAKVSAPADAKTAALPAPLLPNGVAAQTLFGLATFLDHVSDQARAAFDAFQRSPDVWRGFTTIADDPAQRRQLLDAVWRFAAIMGAGLATEWLVRQVLRRPGRRLLGTAPPGAPAPPDPPDPDPLDEAAHPHDPTSHPAHSRRRASAWVFLRRLPLAAARLALDLLPVLGFLLVAHVLLGTPLGGGDLVRLVVLSLVDAYAIYRVLVALARMMLSPDSARLRLLRLSDPAAHYLMHWLVRLVAVAVFGFAISAAGLLLGMSQASHDAVLKAFSLAVHVMLIVIVLQRRGTVARRLRPSKGATGLFAAFGNGLAASWHVFAVFLLAATWLVWAVELQNGFTRLLHFCVVTLGILLLSRLVLIVVLGTLDQTARRRFDAVAPRSAFEARMRAYAPVAHVVLSALVYLVTFLALFEAWGFGTLDWFMSNSGHRLLSSFATVGVTIALALLAWEWANVAVQTHLDRLTAEQQLARSARLRTLLPLLRTTLLVALLIIVGLMVLSDIGVNIAPLLAGAGVLGIAIGFGSQKLVQDVITGLFLLLENTMQVGDVVTAGGLSGVVEYLSIRSIRLRSEDGSVHVIPFSAVTTVTNMTRDFGHAVIEAQVSYEDDVDAVVAVMKDIVTEMRAEPRWQSEIREDLEVMGLDKFAASAIIVKARIRVGPFGRWAVLREFNRRMKLRFAERGIEIPYQHTQQLVLAAVPEPPAPPPRMLRTPSSPPGPTPEEVASKEAIAREAAAR